MAMLAAGVIAAAIAAADRLLSRFERIVRWAVRRLAKRLIVLVTYPSKGVCELDVRLQNDTPNDLTAYACTFELLDIESVIELGELHTSETHSVDVGALKAKGDRLRVLVSLSVEPSKWVRFAIKAGASSLVRGEHRVWRVRPIIETSAGARKHAPIEIWLPSDRARTIRDVRADRRQAMRAARVAQSKMAKPG
jgi:hypothetical protein